MSGVAGGVLQERDTLMGIYLNPGNKGF
jgi:hypothetical protein